MMVDNAYFYCNPPEERAIQVKVCRNAGGGARRWWWRTTAALWMAFRRSGRLCTSTFAICFTKN